MMALAAILTEVSMMSPRILLIPMTPDWRPQDPRL
jgi:hypothetical protein